MSFHLGKPILTMLIVGAIGSVAVALRPAQEKADLDVWVFAEGHHRAYMPIIRNFERDNHVTVNCNMVLVRATSIRLGGMFMSNPKSPDLPDLVEIEIGTIGKYFRHRKFLPAPVHRFRHPYAGLVKRSINSPGRENYNYRRL